MVDYTNCENVLEFLSWSRNVPDHDNGDHTLETTDDSGSIITASTVYLGNTRIIPGTEKLYYGPSVSSVVPLTRDTDYTIDNDIGEITIINGALIGSNNIYSEYKYSKIDDRPGIKGSTVNSIVSAVTKQIDGYCNRTFQPPTQVLQENQDGRGRYDRTYRVLELPVYVIKTQLNGTVTDSATALVVDSSSGLSAGQYIGVEKEALLISTVDSTTTLTVIRGQLGTTGASHADNTNLINSVVEVSTTPFGSNPVYYSLAYLKDYDLDASGRITLLHNDITAEGLFIGQYPERAVPNRVRFTYIKGTSSVPEDVTHAATLMVSEKLVNSSIAKGLGEGVDGFTPRANEVLEKDAKALLSEYKLLLGDGF